MLPFQFSCSSLLRSVLGLGALAVTLRGAGEAAEGVLGTGALLKEKHIHGQRAKQIQGPA